MDTIVELRKNLIKLGAIRHIRLEKIERPVIISKTPIMIHTPSQQETLKEEPVIYQRFTNTNPNSDKTPPKVLTPSKSVNNMFPIDKNEYYFSNSMQNGYLNIKDSKTIKITGGKETAKEKRELYKNQRRRKKQLSNYIINQDKKKSRSLSNNRSCIDFGVKENNKYRNKSRKIGLTFSLLLRKNQIEDGEVMLRGMRDEKGGVVDFCYGGKENDKQHVIMKFTKNSVIYPSKKIVENTKKIQRWWRWILFTYKRLTMKIILLQKWLRGFLFRKHCLNARSPRLYQEKITENTEDNNTNITNKNQKAITFGCLFLRELISNKLLCSYNDVIRRIMNYNEFKNNMNSNIVKLGMMIRKKIFKDNFIEGRTIALLKEKLLTFLILHKDKKARYHKKECFNKWRYNKQNEIVNLRPFTIYSQEEIRPQKLKVLKEQETQTDSIKIEKTIPKRKINSLKVASLIKSIETPIKADTFNTLKASSPLDNSVLNKKRTILKSKRKQLLKKQFTTKDLKNILIAKIYFLKWYRKLLALKNSHKVNLRKKVPKDLLNHFKTNLLRFPFEQIKKEVKRRKIIKLFFHIRNLKYPVLTFVFEKLKKYSDIKYQFMNAYATVIQQYFRMKYINRNFIEDETTINKKQIIIEETYNENLTFTNKSYHSISELFFDFYKKLVIKCLIESLYMKSF